jgi:hypothetical protein
LAQVQKRTLAQFFLPNPLNQKSLQLLLTKMAILCRDDRT